VLETGRARLENRLLAHLQGGRLFLTLTDNRHTMIAVRREQGVYRVRVHHMFLLADSFVVRALARYIATNDRRASRVLGQFIEEHKEHIRGSTQRRRGRRALQPRGAVHDLQTIFDDLNARFFGGAIKAAITWGSPRRGRPRRHRTLRMGSYSVEERLIRIHRALDRPFVPRYFVEWIVFHEMLHQVFEIPTVRGRRRFHTRGFREAEASFPDYARAAQWEREHLSDLLLY